MQTRSNLRETGFTPAASNTRWDCREQLRLIHEHRLELCRELGRDVSPEAAAFDWVEKHAAAWRDRHERAGRALAPGYV